MNLLGFLLLSLAAPRLELRQPRLELRGRKFPTNQVAMGTPATNPQPGSWFTGLAQVT